MRQETAALRDVSAAYDRWGSKGAASGLMHCSKGAKAEMAHFRSPQRSRNHCAAIVPSPRHMPGTATL